MIKNVCHFRCKICKEKFRLQSDLKNHYPTHYIKTDSDIDVTKIKNEAINSEIDGNNVTKINKMAE